MLIRHHRAFTQWHEASAYADRADSMVFWGVLLMVTLAAVMGWL